MKATDDLFLLVKSLTASEKRYFKVFSKRHVQGDVNKYEILYDAYDALPDDAPYDEVKLKASLTDTRISKNFADEKKNLHEMIMKALRSYSAGTSIDTQLSELLIDEELYRSKRLNTLRRKTIEKAKEMAEKYERFEMLLPLLDKKASMDLELSQDTLKEQADRIGLERARVLSVIAIIAELKNLNDWFFIQVRMYASAGVPQNFWEEAEKKLDNETFKSYEPGLCFKADLNYNIIWSNYYLLKRDHISQHKYESAIYDLYETQYPQMKEANPVGYLMTINNVVSSLMTIEQYDQMKVLLDRVEQMKTENDDEAGEAFQLLALFKMIYYNRTGQYGETLLMVPWILDGIKRHRRKVNKARELALLYNIAAAYMMTERWDDVVDYTERIICDKSDARQDIKYGARLYQLIARYELGQIDTLMYQVRNTQRWIDSRSPLSDEYNSILKMLNTAIREGVGYFKKLQPQMPVTIREIVSYTYAGVWFYAKAHSYSMAHAAQEIEQATTR